MPVPSPSYIKNMIRRSFRHLVDPMPNQKELSAVWRHFKNRCAYCDVKLSKRLREGQMDHLEPACGGGSNSLGNFVLACVNCNSKQKASGNWEAHLTKKAPNQASFNEKKLLIMQWQELCGGINEASLAGLIAVAQFHADQICDLYSQHLIYVKQYQDLENKDVLLEDSTLTNSALRFDGYAYEKDHEIDVENLLTRAKDRGIDSLSHPEKFCAFFALQRFLYKWGGERLSRNGPTWRLFRGLFLCIYAEEVPTGYYDKAYQAEWERKIVPRLELCVNVVRAIHATTDYVAEDSLK